jgi:Protein of unknown function (DUF3047)
MRSSAALLALALLAACASVPEDDPLLWSDELVRSLEREKDEEVEVARFSRTPPGELGEPWEPYFIVRGNHPTGYRVVERDGAAVLEAVAEQGGSALHRKIRIDPYRHPMIEWRWQVPPRGPDASPFSEAARASAMARVSIAFHGDPQKLDLADRAHLRLAKALTANGLPYATLVYVWLRSAPAGMVLVSPYSDRVRLFVVESGDERVGQWINVRRNVVEDYRRAFGEDPGDIVAVGVMTDSGDDGSTRRAFYGDITFRSGE